MVTWTKAALSASMAEMISAEVERILMRTATRDSAAETVGRSEAAAPAAAAVTGPDSGAEKGSSCPVAMMATVALSSDWPADHRDEGL